MLRNRMLADPSFLFKVGTEVSLIIWELCFLLLVKKKKILGGSDACTLLWLISNIIRSWMIGIIDRQICHKYCMEDSLDTTVIKLMKKRNMRQIFHSLIVMVVKCV